MDSSEPKRMPYFVVGDGSGRLPTVWELAELFHALTGEWPSAEDIEEAGNILREAQRSAVIH